jgi:hypothetical protein
MTLLSEDDVAELLAFLVTAARTQTDEAPEYGPLRLMTAATTLAGKVGDGGSPELRRLAGLVEAFPPTLTPAADPDGYRERLDELCADVADYLLTTRQVEP